MIPLVSTELRKLRTTRSAWIPLAVALVFAVLAVVVVATAAGTQGNPPLTADMLPALLRGSGGQLVNGAVLLAGIMLSAGEFRHRTSVTTFLGEPRRIRVVAGQADRDRAHRRRGRAGGGGTRGRGVHGGVVHTRPAAALG